MTIEVEGPDGAVHEFPDGTSTDVIKSVMVKHYGAPKTDKPAALKTAASDVLKPFTDTVKGAVRTVKADIDEDVAHERAKRKGFGQEYLEGFTHPFEPGGVLRGAKEVGDVVNAVSSPLTGAQKVVTTPFNKATGLDLDTALMALGAGRKNPIGALSKAKEALQEESTIASAVKETGEAARAEAEQIKPRVRVKAGSSREGVENRGPQPTREGGAADTAHKNALAEAQRAYTKSSGDPKHAERAVRLLDNGVELTVGQRAGGMAKRIEEANKSNPYIGQAIRENERKSLISFNRATAKQSLEAAGLPSNFPKDAEGRDFVKLAHDRFSKAYEANADKYKLKGDDKLVGDLTSVHDALRELPSDMRLQFEAVMDRRVLSRMGATPGKDEGFLDAIQKLKGKELNGKAFKDVESELTFLSGKYHSSPDPAAHGFAENIDDALGALRDNMERSSDPSVRAQLKKLNTGYAMFTRVRAAAQNRATSGGVFTTGDFLGAVKRLDKSAAKGAFARGDALFQDFAEDAHAVLHNVLADSGTTERQNITRPGPVGGILGAGLGAVGGPMGAVVGSGVGTMADTTIQGMTNALADKMMSDRTQAIVTGTRPTAPGSINNYLRAAQNRSGEYGRLWAAIPATARPGAPQDQGPQQ